MRFPDFFLIDIQLAHPSWHEILRQGLEAVHQQNPDYLRQLAQSHFLPNSHRLFAAFSIPLSDVHYVLVGEGPYPREESATGYCFMDGAVDEIWSQDVNGGLSKSVNRATSLRNFVKMLLVADGQLAQADTGSAAIAPIAQRLRSEPSRYVQTMGQLQSNFLRQGFLMLNASLVFRADVAPAVDARAWLPFLQVVFQSLTLQKTRPELILWGKIADRLGQISVVGEFVNLKSEHPYNLSFISNATMQNLFASLNLLHR
ncbi:uracil-DNA glycosylase family protein [Undibacterium flavidum]|uniref:Uracil-DNA glycosylase n=1 Tax=Undibacterium flavidum TaxID=2762297 RepID=A0ABR6Y6Q5_9BURK|nr:uracil-DNA glycosylase [Undibacterium flavidum]MBC3872258.1 uracil-DNA glycosylase [Undibacterium flavidum]